MATDLVRNELLRLVHAGNTGGAASGDGRSPKPSPLTSVTGNYGEIGNQLQQIGPVLSQLLSVQQATEQSLLENTKALAQNTASKSQGTSAASQVGGFFESIFGSTLSPILTGILGLFGGDGGSGSLPALSPYLAPPKIQLDLGIGSGSGVSQVDHDASGGVRSLPAAAAPQVTVQVQAIDSRSFLDHSDAIAQAVRQALLQGSSLQDVLTEI